MKPVLHLTFSTGGRPPKPPRIPCSVTGMSGCPTEEDRSPTSNRGDEHVGFWSFVSFPIPGGNETQPSIRPRIRPRPIPARDRNRRISHLGDMFHRICTVRFGGRTLPRDSDASPCLGWRITSSKRQVCGSSRTSSFIDSDLQTLQRHTRRPALQTCDRIHPPNAPSKKVIHWPFLLLCGCPIRPALHRCLPSSRKLVLFLH